MRRPLSLLVLALFASPVLAGPPPVEKLDALALAARIDQHIAAKWQAQQTRPAAPADDAEFVRRLYLDLAGRIPRYDEVRDFLDDRSPAKRQRLVETLLTGEDHVRYYTRHFTNVWRALLVPQTNQQFQRVSTPLDDWVAQQLRDNVGYDRMVRDLLTTPVIANAGGRPVNPAGPSPRLFYQFNENKPENLAASVSKLFLGVKLECAQCHDHPFAPWTRQQFWQFAAFFAGIQPQQPRGGVVQDRSNLREIQIPGTEKTVSARFLDGTEPPAGENVAVRNTLADWLATAENPFFAKAAVNRLWAHFFGIGLTEPIDEPCDDNPPSHPELLDELTRQFAANGFNVKYLIRAVTHSRTYQLSGKQTHDSQGDPRLFARMALKGLTAEQLYDNLVLATGYRDATPAQRQAFVNTPRADILTKFANHADKRTEFQTSILQALALMNGPFVAETTSVGRSQTLAGVLNAPFLDTAGRVEVLYLSTLSRKPRPEETERLVRYVDGGGADGDAKKALSDVFWALLNSTEFILNH